MLGAIGMLFVFILFVDSPHQARAKVYEEAVGAGAAHWEADPKTGETKFIWTPPPEEKGTHDE
jgi:hypothetical protein